MKLVLLLVVLTCACHNPWRFVYTNTDSLAVEQDSLIKMYNRGQVPCYDTIRDLKINWWVISAEKVAPNNLVIRQWCLIDLFTNSLQHGPRLVRLVDLLSGGAGNYRTWAEGYSYWLYSKEALVPWMKKFPNDSVVKIVGEMVRAIDNGFAATYYLGNDGSRRPAPFADLWNIPLDSDSFCMIPGDTIKVKNITLIKTHGEYVYQIAPMPMGFNGHCEDKASVRPIVAGVPSNFSFYEGYHNKYKTEKAEWLDLLNPIRIFTIPFIW